MRRIVFSIAFFQKKLPVQSTSTSTKSRWKFYTQVGHRSFHTAWVESRCGAVALGRTYLLPPLSSGGASMVPPWFRFHIHRFPQNVACGFTALRSSAVGSQLSLLSVQVSFPWSADLLS